jgi:hypothetical protein
VPRKFALPDAKAEVATIDRDIAANMNTTSNEPARLLFLIAAAPSPGGTSIQLALAQTAHGYIASLQLPIDPYLPWCLAAPMPLSAVVPPSHERRCGP